MSSALMSVFIWRKWQSFSQKGTLAGSIAVIWMCAMPFTSTLMRPPSFADAPAEQRPLPCRVRRLLAHRHVAGGPAADPRRGERRPRAEPQAIDVLEDVRPRRDRVHERAVIRPRRDAALRVGRRDRD